MRTLSNVGMWGLSMLMVIVFIAALILAGLGLAYVLNIPSCPATAAGLGYESRNSFWVGCQIKIGDQWVPLDKYRAVDPSK